MRNFVDFSNISSIIFVILIKSTIYNFIAVLFVTWSHGHKYKFRFHTPKSSSQNICIYWIWRSDWMFFFFWEWVHNMYTLKVVWPGDEYTTCTHTLKVLWRGDEYTTCTHTLKVVWRRGLKLQIDLLISVIRDDSFQLLVQVVQVNYCHHLASVICCLSSVNFSHFKLLRNHWADWNQT